MTDVNLGVKVDVSKLILEPYHPLCAYMLTNEYSHYFVKGGRQSGKTVFSALMCILNLFKDPNSNALCLRNDFAHLRKSVYNEVKKAISFIDEMHSSSLAKMIETRFNGYSGEMAERKYDEAILEKSFKSKLQPLEIVFKDTGQLITFAGANEPEKIKGLTTANKNKYYGYIWFDEFQEVNQGVDKAMNIRATCERGNAEQVISIYTYNPPPNPKHWINQSITKNFYNAREWHKNYNDLPNGIISEGTKKQAEHLRVVNNPKYRNVWLGEPVGTPEGLVFHNKFEVKEFATPPTSQMYNGQPFFGADWGFNDATTLIKSFAIGNDLYVSDEIYLQGTLVEEVVEEFKQMPGLFEGAGMWNIIADSSNPTMIAECVNKGLTNIDPAKKGKDSVVAGISYLKLFNKIYIHPRCKYTIDEFNNYRYAEDKITGKYLPKIKDGDDHCIDALRYAWEDMMRSDVHPSNYAQKDT